MKIGTDLRTGEDGAGAPACRNEEAMKTLRMVSSPTRNRRLNEVLGVIALASAGLMLLALGSYTPSDPSFDTVGGTGGMIAGMARPAHNWIGLAGAYFADLLLQVLGVAAFFLPLLLVRLGVCWVRSHAAGAALAKWVGFSLWVVFAPAALSLLLRGVLWRQAVPVEGLSGRMVGDGMVQMLNLPGASIVVALMVSLSLYLATTFSFSTAREWGSARFGFATRMHARWAARREQGDLETVSPLEDAGEVYGAKREKLEQRARRAR